jgi:regulator of protease activity HflC (stomatin/prohibitin superfamily)
MKKESSVYRSAREYNPVLWTLQKKLFAARRYGINGLLLLAGAAVYMVLPSLSGVSTGAAISVALVFIAIGCSVRIAFEWERVPVLRLGKYRGVKGPGIFFLLPLIDTTYGYVDSRITVTDFSAEKVLTKDAVPIYVDAIIFWMIWDAGKARLEVENYQSAVPLSAKTALREIIGKTTLARLLTDRDEIGAELQKILDAKTNPWGITSLSVEIKDIVVPQELEDAISREAQAEREKNARVILGSAEIELAEKYAIASEKYKGNEEALSLRSMNLLFDAVKNKGSMILVPSDTPNMINKALSLAIAKNTSQAETGGNDT